MNERGEQSLLNVQGLTKTFAIRRGLAVTRFHAVDQASLVMQTDRSEIVALAGESGSGKTTLARMVLGMISPSAGSITFRGRDVSKLTVREKRSWFMRQVQPVFQDPYAAFSPLKRVEQYLFTTAHNYRAERTGGTREAVDEALHAVGLSLQEIGGRYPSELSGGQLQRVAIARALITNPALLVADEPVSMLDASLRMSVVNLLKELREQQGVSVIYITHDLATAYYAADRISIMLRGWIVESGPVESVLGDPMHPYTRLLKQSVPEADPDKRWEGRTDLAMLEAEEYLMGGCKFAGRCPQVMDRCKEEAPENASVDGRAVRCWLYAS